MNVYAIRRKSDRAYLDCGEWQHDILPNFWLNPDTIKQTLGFLFESGDVEIVQFELVERYVIDPKE